MKFRSIVLCCSLLFPALLYPQAMRQVIDLPAGTTSRVSTARIIVAPDRSDWTYAVAEPVSFRVAVLYDGQPLRGVEIEYQVGPELYESAPQKMVLEEGETFLGGYRLDSPGFIRCIVNATIQGRSYTGLATVAYAPLEIEPTQTEPEDFDAFWDSQLEQLKGIPLGMTKTLLPERCTADVNVFLVRYLSSRGGRPTPFYGILTEPSVSGEYPAVLRLPGGGVRAYPGQPGLSANGIIVLEIGIHGIPVNLPPGIYDDLRSGALANYRSAHMESPQQYYHNRVYLGCVRALDVLTSQPMWDGHNLIVSGGSQGGIIVTRSRGAG